LIATYNHNNNEIERYYYYKKCSPENDNNAVIFLTSNPSNLINAVYPVKSIVGVSVVDDIVDDSVDDILLIIFLFKIDVDDFNDDDTNPLH
jgi:hypothetical protein